MNHHEKIEKNSIVLLILITIVVSIGGIIEIVPLFRVETTIEPVKGVRPYTPLELAGKKIYLREGCYNCHSQQIRVLRDEVERYGHYSLAAESMYDFPFQWGSKRTGPDLARVGGKYSDDWHVRHLQNPRSLVPDSIMPSYGSLSSNAVDIKDIDKDMKVLRMLGVPYTDDMIRHAKIDARVQAMSDAGDFEEGLYKRYSTINEDGSYGAKLNVRNFDGQNLLSEMDALVAYLQVLGTMADLKNYESRLNKK